MYCSYYDRLLIMGDDMFIIAYEQAVIMHDQRHIHDIMNIIVNPTSDIEGQDARLSVKVVRTPDFELNLISPSSYQYCSRL